MNRLVLHEEKSRAEGEIEIPDFPWSDGMSQRIETERSFQGSMPLSEGGRGETVEGFLDGEQVTVAKNASSLIEDAAEELTFSASEKVEKDVKKRKVGKKGEGDEAQGSGFYVRKASKIKKFVQDLRKDRPGAVRELLGRIALLFKDVTDQYLALSYAKKLLEEEKEGDEELANAMGASLQYLLDSQGPSIRAGLNIAETAEAFSVEKGPGGLGPVQELRDFYRDTVLKYEGFNETYESVLKNFPPENFLQATQYLIRAAGNDLHSKGPSISPVELKAVLDDLYHLESMGNLYRDFSRLGDKISREFEERIGPPPHEILHQVLSLKEEKWITENRVLDFVDATGLKDEGARIYFLQGVRELVRLMPGKLFSDEESRRSLLDKMQEALDTLVDREEEGVEQ